MYDDNVDNIRKQRDDAKGDYIRGFPVRLTPPGEVKEQQTSEEALEYLKKGQFLTRKKVKRPLTCRILVPNLR